MNASNATVVMVSRIAGAIGGTGLALAFFSGVIVVTNSYLMAVLCWLIYILGTMLAGYAGSVVGGLAARLATDEERVAALAASARSLFARFTTPKAE
ncbi:MAG: hypothetical protein QG602_3940 [Verrucomicrobiota bacterium]|nr:hypothetical protein [Verrucomicrobiota bacterium]